MAAHLGISSVVSTHSRPKAAGGLGNPALVAAMKFQLTAARRRLVLPFQHIQPRTFVSTHSRPKAAGNYR